MDDWLKDFVRESNRIEGILRLPTPDEVAAHSEFIAKEQITIDDFVALVGVLQPDARLRDKTSVPGVRVGNHVAPPSGPGIRHALSDILELATGHGGDFAHVHSPISRSPYTVHTYYEQLHPFTDGNGRSGRALWLWMMLRGSKHQQAQAQQLGFLHSFYYQTLEAAA
jgi:hypothetical protein